MQSKSIKKNKKSTLKAKMLKKRHGGSYSSYVRKLLAQIYEEENAAKRPGFKDPTNMIPVVDAMVTVAFDQILSEVNKLAGMKNPGGNGTLTPREVQFAVASIIQGGLAQDLTNRAAKALALYSSSR